MRVLVTTASRHGSTAEMGESIGRVLGQAGFGVEVRPVAEVTSVEGYDAVVLGSAVYVGRWLPAATAFVETHAAALRQRPLWLFSSGPIGAPEAKPAGDPEGVAALVEELGARTHRTFSGRVDRSLLGIGEKLIIKAVRAPEGDYRDWPAIESWARGIATQLARSGSDTGARATVAAPVG